jgi:putative phosphoesterase
MIKIGLLSDTHGFIDDKVLKFFETCDEIWHAGDIGNIETADKIAAFKPLKAVHGNIDNHKSRIVYPEHLRFNCENVNVWITHIGGYPGHYDVKVRKEMNENPPRLFICGHSHILKVIYDKQNNLLHINPGAAGISGFHKIRTAVRFKIDGNEIKELEILEIERTDHFSNVEMK